MAGKSSTSQTKSTVTRPVPGVSKGTVLSILAVGLIIFAGSSWAWWHYVRSNPERVFAAMLENNLRTRGVSNRIQQKATGQSLDQTVQLTTGPAHSVNSQTLLTQEGENTSSVKTEIIGTPFVEYVRYVDIQTTQKREDGTELDFSTVKNIWGKTGGETGPNAQPTGDLYNQSVLDVVPFANLPAAARARILDQIRSANVYEVDYSKTERSIKNGRPVYNYTVALKPGPYVGMLKELGKNIGLTQLANVDPEAYKDAEPVEFTFSVDVWTRQLIGVNYPGNARSETIGSFGIKRHFSLPQQSIPVTELQAKLQSLQ